MSQSEQKYKIKVDAKTTFTVNLNQLFKPRWIEYFGSAEEVKEFIKNYKA